MRASSYKVTHIMRCEWRKGSMTSSWAKEKVRRGKMLILKAFKNWTENTSHSRTLPNWKSGRTGPWEGPTHSILLSSSSWKIVALFTSDTSEPIQDFVISYGSLWTRHLIYGLEELRGCCRFLNKMKWCEDVVGGFRLILWNYFSKKWVLQNLCFFKSELT